ncbi:Hypp5726 [Branchiostoma lanceolatum]|uniref:Hypp5726 protein n=1 Tax=Branchiostoma lanceolatum TaxID=7740 RepID=A0A8J9YM55_BRALA|nr:Hypp5726 [Branchiostoma lanceolatum]
MVLHPGKCKVLHVQFSRALRPPPPLKINDNVLEQVGIMRILGVYLQSDLKWNVHVNFIYNKASQRLFLLCRVKHFRTPKDDLVIVYTSYIRPVTEYAAPVWHPGLTAELNNKIERIQRRAVRIILGRDYTCYAEACAHLGLPSLHSRRSNLTLKFAKSLMVSEQYRHLLPPTRANISHRQTRSANNLDMPKCRTERYRTSAIPHMVRVHVLNTSLV